MTSSSITGVPASEQEVIVEVMDSVRSIVRALRLNTRSIEQKLGISLAQLWILQILQAGPAESLNELAIATATHQSSVSVVVRRLADRAYVTRSPARDDKRRVRIELTDAGRQILQHAPSTVQLELMAGLREMAPEERRQLAQLMRKWLTTAGLDLELPPPMLMEDDA